MPWVSNQSMGDQSSIVSDFYDRFPYPGDPLIDEPPRGFNWRWCLDNVYAFCTGALPLKIGSRKRFRILDAGCGSGVSTDYLAHLNPGSEILAVDISKGTLSVALERLRRSGGKDKAELHFKNINILNMKSEGLFDYINSVGVIHHLSDPLEGLKTLTKHLKNGGILHLFVYAEGGRWEIGRIQKALKNMRVSNDKNDIQLSRSLLQNLPKNNRLRRNHEEKWLIDSQSDVNFADMYLHPRETTFNIETLFQLIEDSNLEFLGFSNPNIWSLGRLLKGDLLDRVNVMTPMQKFQLVEILDPDISHFELFLSKGPLKHYQWGNDDDLLATTGKISRSICGQPSQVFYDYEFNRIELTKNCLKLIEVIEKEPTKPLGLLPLGWHKSLIASTARDLTSRQLLLLYPP